MTSVRRFYQAVFGHEVPECNQYQGELIREPVWGPSIAPASPVLRAGLIWTP